MNGPLHNGTDAFRQEENRNKGQICHEHSASSLEHGSNRLVVPQKPWRKGSSKCIKEPFLTTYVRVHKVLSLLKNIVQEGEMVCHLSIGLDMSHIFQVRILARTQIILKPSCFSFPTGKVRINILAYGISLSRVEE